MIDMQTVPVLSPMQCEDLIRVAAPRLTPAQVGYEADRRAIADVRRCDNVKFHVDNLLTSFIKQRIAAVVGADPLDLEPVEVVRYEVGGFFQKHHDGKWRSHSAVIALNEGYEGGHLRFSVMPDQNVMPDLGNALIWSNWPPHLTQHESTPVSKGEKWVAVVWVCGPDVAD